MRKHLLFALTVCAAACGSDKTSIPATGQGELDTAGSTAKFASNASKMAQQATFSTQSQADQSEVATTGSDLDASTTDSVMSKRKGGQLEVRGWNQLAGMGNVTGDFDLTLSFDQYVGSNQATANGNVDVRVRRGKDGSQDVALSGTLKENFPRGGEVQASFEPNFVVKKNGDRGQGRVNRALTGTVRRALKEALGSETGFDFFIGHAGTTVTDLYVSGSLSSRAISGTITVTDATTQDVGKLVFTDVVRANPSKCLCPESGTIQVSYTSGVSSEQFLVSFGSTCGEVTLTPQVPAVSTASSVESSASASTAEGASKTSVSTAVSSDSSVSSPADLVANVVTWDACLPD